MADALLPHPLGVEDTDSGAEGGIIVSAAASDAKDALLDALNAAWLRRTSFAGSPKPVPGAEDWKLYWVKRRGSETGDAYLFTPHDDRLRSMKEARRWLDSPFSAKVKKREMQEWAACDECDKWRQLPVGARVDGSAQWFCHMHPVLNPPPVPYERACDVPEGGEHGDGQGAACSEDGVQRCERQAKVAEHAAKASVAAQAEGFAIAKMSCAFKQVHVEPSSSGAPYQASGHVGGRAYPLGAYVSREEAALAIARFERATEFVLRGCDPRLVGQTIAIYYAIDDAWYRGRVVKPVGEGCDAQGHCDGQWLVEWDTFSPSWVELSKEVWRVEAPPAGATNPPEPLYAAAPSVAAAAVEGAAVEGAVAPWLPLGYTVVAAPAAAVPGRAASDPSPCVLQTAKEVWKSRQPPTLDADALLTQAAREGLELVRDPSSESGFEGVLVRHTTGRASGYTRTLYCPRLRSCSNNMLSGGSDGFVLAEAAALCAARNSRAHMALCAAAGREAAAAVEAAGREAAAEVEAAREGSVETAREAAREGHAVGLLAAVQRWAALRSAPKCEKRPPKPGACSQWAGGGDGAKVEAEAEVEAGEEEEEEEEEEVEEMDVEDEVEEMLRVGDEKDEAEEMAEAQRGGVPPRIEVWWPNDSGGECRGLYVATVVGYSEKHGEHTLHYDDGDQETINLQEHRWHRYLVRDRTPQLQPSPPPPPVA